MRISFLCSDELHPVNDYLLKWIKTHSNHNCELVRKKNELSGGDILFLISCSEIVKPEDRSAYQASLVLHASDLPQGRGWSPHIWKILEGADEITLSLLEAEDKVDSGRIWYKLPFTVPKNALWDEINERLFDAELKLISLAVDNFANVTPYSQNLEIEASYFPRRTPEDSRIDPSQSLDSQFDKLRVCDPNRFPAFFEARGKKYKIILEKYDE